MSLYYRITAGIIWLIATSCLLGALFYVFMAFNAIYAILFVKNSHGVGIVVVFAAILAGMFAVVGVPFFYITTRAFYFDFKKDVRAEELFKKVHKWFLLALVAIVAYVLYVNLVPLIFV